MKFSNRTLCFIASYLHDYKPLCTHYAFYWDDKGGETLYKRLRMMVASFEYCLWRPPDPPVFSDEDKYEHISIDPTKDMLELIIRLHSYLTVIEKHGPYISKTDEFKALETLLGQLSINYVLDHHSFDPSW